MNNKTGRFEQGGSLALTTNAKGMNKNNNDVFRCGDPNKTSDYEKLFGSNILPFSKEDKSYYRLINKFSTKYFQSILNKEIPSNDISINGDEK